VIEELVPDGLWERIFGRFDDATWIYHDGRHVGEVAAAHDRRCTGLRRELVTMAPRPATTPIRPSAPMISDLRPQY
jgi:hypothetical protein